MIFPPIRISELKQDQSAKKKSFDTSKRVLKKELQLKTRPLVLIKDNHKLIMGVILSMLTSARFLKSAGRYIVGKKKKNIAWGLFKTLLKGFFSKKSFF